MQCITLIHVKHLFIYLNSYMHGFSQLVLQPMVAKKYFTESVCSLGVVQAAAAWQKSTFHEQYSLDSGFLSVAEILGFAL